MFESTISLFIYSQHQSKPWNMEEKKRKFENISHSWSIVVFSPIKVPYRHFTYIRNSLNYSFIKKIIDLKSIYFMNTDRSVVTVETPNPMKIKSGLQNTHLNWMIIVLTTFTQPNLHSFISCLVHIVTIMDSTQRVKKILSYHCQT